MSEHDPLDALREVLRGPATDGELADGDRTVALMADAHHAAQEKPMRSRTRPARVATLIAAGVLGFGGVAAAGPGGFDTSSIPVEELTAMDGELDEPEEPGSETTVPSSVPDDEGSTTSVAGDEGPEGDEPEGDEPEGDEPEGDEPEGGEEPEGDGLVEPLDEGGPVDDPDTTFDESKYCLPDGNHGKTVSYYARNKDELAELPEGYTMSDVAQSSCGKQGGDDVDGDGDDLELDEDEKAGDGVDGDDLELAEADEDDDRGGRPEWAGQGKDAKDGKDDGAKDKGGKSNGKAGGKGNGKAKGGR